MKKKSIVICLAVCLAITCIRPIFVSAKPLSSLTSDNIQNMQDQIEEAEKEKENLNSTLSDLKKIKTDLEKKKKNLKNYVAELDGYLEEMEQNILELKLKIEAKQEAIVQTEEELEKALEREANQKESMVQRIRCVYEKGTPQMAELLFTSSSFGDFLNKADFVEKVVAYDRMMWDEYKENRELVELCKQELELEKQLLDQAKANVEAEQENLESLIEQKSHDIVKYESDINNKDKAIKEYEAEIAAQNAEIKALEDAIAEEKKQLLENSGDVISYDNGEFKFPLASYTRISDDYGKRIHPILGVEQFHNGVDFAAPKGTAIYSAYDGRVVAATYSATMGNYVMIDHGDSLFTIYMHASALYVSKGDVVVRGENIAAVGSTGRSTGNHLHFSVRRSGNYESPWNYLKK